MRVDRKLFVLLAIGVLAAILSLLTLTFHVVKLNGDTADLLRIGGFESLIELGSINGFYLVENLSDLEDDFKFYGIMNIFIIISAVVHLLAFGYFAVAKKEEKWEAVALSSIGSFVVIGVFYLIQGLDLRSQGLDLRSQMKDAFDSGFQITSGYQAVPKELGFTTEAFWPLIIAVVLVVVYWAVDKWMLSDVEKAYIAEHYGIQMDTTSASKPVVQKPVVQKESVTVAPQKDTLSEEKKLELLLKYKELKDSGVLTDEEFEKKKKELL